jgi:hypothetical protein
MMGRFKKGTVLLLEGKLWYESGIFCWFQHRPDEPPSKVSHCALVVDDEDNVIEAIDGPFWQVVWPPANKWRVVKRPLDVVVADYARWYAYEVENARMADASVAYAESLIGRRYGLLQLPFYAIDCLIEKVMRRPCRFFRSWVKGWGVLCQDVLRGNALLAYCGEPDDAETLCKDWFPLVYDSGEDANG